MELTILDSIIHGPLKPWKINLNDTRRFREIVKSAMPFSNNTTDGLHGRIQELLNDFPSLRNSVSNSIPKESQIHQLKYQWVAPPNTDIFSTFYSLLIEAEILRVFNSFVYRAIEWTSEVDIQYQVGKILTNIKVLAKQTSTELQERGYVESPIENSSLVHFVLFYLKNNLVTLYLSIQKGFENHLVQKLSLEQFFLLELEEPRSSIDKINLAENSEGVEQIYTKAMQIEILNNENVEIERIEIALRKFIMDKLGIGSMSAYKQIVPPHIQKKLKEAIDNEHRKNPGLVNTKQNNPEYVMQFSDLRDLESIIVAKSNWEAVSSSFGTKEGLAIEFNNLGGLRNPVRHSREVDEISLLKGKAAIKWFKQQLGLM